MNIESKRFKIETGPTGTGFTLTKKAGAHGPAWRIVFHAGGGWRGVRGDAETDSDVTPYCATESEAREAATEAWPDSEEESGHGH